VTSASFEPSEGDRLLRRAAPWWDPEGAFRPLHRLGPARLLFIRSRFLAHFGRDPDSLAPFTGLSLLDVGCGGGLVAEPMARLGFSVTAIDADEEAIDAAKAHAEASGLAIDYRVESAESPALAGAGFDAVLALEIVEHLADPAVFFAVLGGLVRPGGAFIGATLNRTARSFALAILGAEYLLRWLPPGSHDWRGFVRPSEFVLALRRAGLSPIELAGMSYDILSGAWTLSRDLGVNYLVMAVRR
jgi:2-polyprenyl-6-hydroxyphenyl methylase / 3-demethylubiquinone-9 3-methyltransferase